MLSQIEQEFQEYDESRQWMEVYRRIKNESSLSTMDEEFTVTEARSAQNRSKNRYRDVSPYDHSRVVLVKDGEEDYINASLVEVPEAGRKYILTQGPLDHTCGDFWLMVWQQKTKAVVMLNRVQEKGTVKCAQYYPLGSEVDCEMLFRDAGLRVRLMGQQDCKDFVTRWLELKDMESGETREVVHFQYVTWPDFGVPASPFSFLNFLHVVREAGSLSPDVGPAVIHCSAGIGRSGTFCIVDSCLVLIEKYSSLSCIDLRKMLISMRSYRMGLIQTPEQLRFSYLAVIQGGQVILGQDDNFNIKHQVDVSPQRSPSESPPPPPTRVTSLPEYRRSVGYDGSESDDDTHNIDRRLAALIDDDDEAPPDLPPKKGLPPYVYRNLSKEEEEEEETSYTVRRRIREERIKNTQEQIKNMKERQRKSETWKKRRSYLQPICFGLAIIVGSYMFYRFYLKY